MNETAKIIQFHQVMISGDLYIIALDDHGALWKQKEGEGKWVCIPGPTISQHVAEDVAESKRESASRHEKNPEESNFRYIEMLDGTFQVERDERQ